MKKNIISFGLFLSIFLLVACNPAFEEYQTNVNAWNTKNIKDYRYQAVLDIRPSLDTAGVEGVRETLTITIKDKQPSQIINSAGDEIDLDALLQNPSYRVLVGLVSHYVIIDRIFNLIFLYHTTNLTDASLVVTYNSDYNFPETMMANNNDRTMKMSISDFEVLE